MSSSQSPIVRPRVLDLPRIVPPRRAVVNSRRSFLAWLGAGTALAAVGCATSASDRDDRIYGPGEEPIGSDEAAQTEADGGVCGATTRDATGPYYEPGAPIRTVSIAEVDEPGVPLLVEGRLLGPDCRTPLRGYTLDLWQASAAGKYSAGTGEDFKLRGKITTDAFGRYSFETVLPGRYSDSVGIRPAHIHVKFVSPGQNVLLTTQLYFKGDPYLGAADYCTAQGTCNSKDADRQLVLQNAIVGKRVGKRTAFDAVMRQS